MNKPNEAPNKGAGDAWRSTLMEDRKLLNNVLRSKTEIAKAKEVGYSRTEIYKGLGMVDDIQLTDMACGEKLLEKELQESIFEQSLKNLKKEYQKHLEIARNLFNREEKRFAQRLNLEGKTFTTLEETIEQIIRFYYVALQEKEVINAFEKRGISKEFMQQMQNMVAELVDNKQLAYKKSVMAENALHKLENKKELFQNWLAKFKTVYQPSQVLQSKSAKKKI